MKKLFILIIVLLISACSTEKVEVTDNSQRMRLFTQCISTMPFIDRQEVIGLCDEIIKKRFIVYEYAKYPD